MTAIAVYGTPQGIPGRAVTVGAHLETQLGDLLDRAHHQFDSAAHRTDTRAWMADYALGNGILLAAAVITNLDPVDIDRIYTQRFGELPAETYRQRHTR